VGFQVLKHFWQPLKSRHEGRTVRITTLWTKINIVKREKQSLVYNICTEDLKQFSMFKKNLTRYKNIGLILLKSFQFVQMIKARQYNVFTRFLNLASQKHFVQNRIDFVKIEHKVQFTNVAEESVEYFDEKVYGFQIG
jgi:hypothetical protein